jgi:hypothetical protein
MNCVVVLLVRSGSALVGSSRLGVALALLRSSNEPRGVQQRAGACSVRIQCGSGGGGASVPPALQAGQGELCRILQNGEAWCGA